MQLSNKSDKPESYLTERKRLSGSQSFLKRFSERYRDPSKLAEILPTLKKRVKRIQKIEGIPHLPEGFTSITDKKTKLEIIKWQSSRNGQLLSYYDDGSPLPEISKMHIVSQSITEVATESSQVQVSTWVLKR